MSIEPFRSAMGGDFGRATAALALRRRRRNIKFCLGAVAWLGLLLLLAPAGAQAESQLFFDRTGSDQAAFGPNEIITVSGNLTYLTGCGDGISDSFVGTFANVFIVEHNSFSERLADVRGSATIIRSDFFGNAFIEEELAATGPTGILKSGEYDLIIDECQNGFWDEGTDLRVGGDGGGPAFTVFVPSNVEMPASAEILAMKAHANEQAAAWEAITRREAVAFAIADLAYIGQAASAASLAIYKLPFARALGAGPLGFMVTLQLNELLASAQTAKKYIRMSEDPPDAAYRQLVALAGGVGLAGAKGPASITDANALLVQGGAQVNAMQQEGLLLDGLLAAFEKYQGTQPTGNGYWALAHAREIQMFSGLLADQLPRTEGALAGFRTAVAANAQALDQGAADLQSLQARIRDAGFSAAEQGELLGLGFGSDARARARENLLQQDYSLSSTGLLSELDALIAVEGAAAAAYKNLSNSMTNIISRLTAQDSLEQSQPLARLNGPFSGQAGTAVTLDASGSADPHGLGLTFAWDLDGDGVFNDASGAVMTVTLHGRFSGHIGVKVTNDSGKEAISYAHLEVTDANRAPLFGTVTPSDGVQTVAPGGSLAFGVSATDPDGDPVTIQWLVDGTVAATAASFTYKPGQADAGLHLVEARASDGRTASGVSSHDWLVPVARPLVVTDLSIVGKASSNSETAGGSLVYTFTIVNRGPNAAPEVTFTNALPNGFSFVTATSSQGTTAEKDGVVTAALGSIAVGGSALVNVTVTANQAGFVTNLAVVSSGAADSDLSNNLAILPTRINVLSPSVADLGVTAVTSPAHLTLGSTFYYVLTVTNAGPDTATGIVLIDTLPPGLTYAGASVQAASTNGNIFSFTLPDLTARAATAITLIISPGTTGTFTNSTVVTANELEPNPADNSLSQPTVVTGPSAHYTDLSLTQNIAPVPGVISNQFSIALTLTNRGPDDMTGATIVDTLPPGTIFVSAIPEPVAVSANLVTFSIGSISSGQSGIAVIQAIPTLSGTSVNSASVASFNTDTDSSNDQTRLEFRVDPAPTMQADLSVEVSSASTQLSIGTAVTITITVTNAGPNAAANTVLSGAFPDGLSVTAVSSSQGTAAVQNGAITGSLDTLPTGGTSTVTITATVTKARPLLTIARVRSDAGDSRPENNVGSVSVLGLDPAATIAIVQNLADPEIDRLQAYLAEMGLASQVLNQAITFEQLQPFRLVIYDDVSYSYGGLSAVYIPIYAQLYSAGVRMYFIGDDLANSIAALTDPERSMLSALLHLKPATSNGNAGSMDIINPVHPVVAGPFGLVQNSPYLLDADTANATGTGETVLARSGFDDVLLAYKDPATKNKTVTQNELVYGLGGSPSSDANGVVQRKILFQNAVGWLLTDDPSTDLSVNQTSSPQQVSVTDELVLTLTVVNHGPDPASGVTLFDNLPGNSTLIAISATQGALSAAHHSVTARIGPLVSGGIATMNLRIRADAEGFLTNLVKVAGLEEDPAQNNNLSTNLITIGPIGAPGSVPKVDLVLTQGAPGTTALGEEFVYTLILTNSGPYTATNVKVHDVLPAQVEYLSAQASQGTTTQATGTIDAAIGSIPVGATATVSIRVRPTALGTLSNYALANSDLPDLNSLNNASSSTIVVTAPLPPTTLLLDLRSTDPTVPIGNNATYSVSISNLGTNQASGTFTFPIPAGTEFVSSPAGAPTSGLLTYNFGAVPPGAIINFNLTLRGTVPGQILAQAFLASDAGGNDAASVTTTFFQPAPPSVDLAVFSAVNDTYVPPGSNLLYTILITNNSPTIATDVLLTNTLPAAATFISATSSRGLVTQNNGVVRVNIGTLTNNSSVTVTITALPSEPAVLDDRSELSSAQPDGNPADNLSFVRALSEVLITGEDLLGNDLRISFESSAGKHYVIQHRLNLGSDNWANLPGTETVGTSHRVGVIIVGALSLPHQFYRVVLQP